MYIVADRNLSSLNLQTFHYNAEDGRHGSSNNKFGRAGKHSFIRVPCGTIISENDMYGLHNYLVYFSIFMIFSIICNLSLNLI